MATRRKAASPVEIGAYQHPAPPSTQEPDTAPGPYYVSVVDGARMGLLAGPFETHAEALAMVPRARAEAERGNPWATFYGFGTARMKESYDRPGVLNDLLGLPSNGRKD